MVLDENSLENIIYGAAFLGSGGGGAIDSGFKFLREVVDSEKKINLITFPLSETNKNLISCVVCDIGSISKFSLRQSDALMYALHELKEYFEEFKQFKAFFPIETGPENTMAPFALAAKLNGEIFVVDGDGAGRAVPTLPLTTFFSFENLKYPSPIAIANGEGDVMLVKGFDFNKFDIILRHVANLREFDDSASLAMWPDTVGNLAINCIEGTISRALSLGQLFASIRDNKNLENEALYRINKLQGYIICNGKVKKKIEADDDAFKFTTIVIENESNLFTVIGQNESLIVFNEKLSSPIALAPDSICYLKANFYPLTNVEITEGDDIFVIGIKAHKKLLNSNILNSFKRILLELGYGGNINLEHTKTKPLGNLILSLNK